MIPFRQLSPVVRTALLGPWLLLVAFVGLGATPAFRQLLLDPATNQPAAAVSLSGPNWTGTLHAARLPADPVACKFIAPSAVQADSGFVTASGNFYAGEYGIYLDGNLVADPGGILYAPVLLVAPAITTETLRFPGNSQLHCDGDSLTWTDADGNQHVLAHTP